MDDYKTIAKNATAVTPTVTPGTGGTLGSKGSNSTSSATGSTATTTASASANSTTMTNSSSTTKPTSGAVPSFSAATQGYGFSSIALFTLVVASTAFTWIVSGSTGC